MNRPKKRTRGEAYSAAESEKRELALQAKVQRLRRERDDWRQSSRTNAETIKLLHDRALAAEAKCEQIEGEVASKDRMLDDCYRAQKEINAALAEMTTDRSLWRDELFRAEAQAAEAIEGPKAEAQS